MFIWASNGEQGDATHHASTTLWDRIAMVDGQQPSGHCV